MSLAGLRLCDACSACSDGLLLFAERGAFLLEHVQEGLGRFEDLDESALCFLDGAIVLIARLVLLLEGAVEFRKSFV